MTGVTVRFARDPALVRTVRLVAAAVARRAGRDEEFVEEVRLAVGEACGLLTSVDEASPGLIPSSDTVTVRLQVEPTFQVAVSARDGSFPRPGSESDPPDPWTPTDPWALLRGLVEHFSVRHEDGSVVLSLAWPPGLD